MQEVNLRTLDLDPAVQSTRDAMRAKFGRRAVDRRFPRDLWARHSYTLQRVRSYYDDHPTGFKFRLLDVGCGQGQFLNACAASGAFADLVGIDVREYTHYVNVGGWERRELDVCELDYGPWYWDVVTACEVLEHLDDTKLACAVEAINSAAPHVFVTVPYRERRLPSYHRQRFDEDRLRELLPECDLTLLRKTRGTDWIVAEL